ncbi:MAG: hypothetical protein AB7O97_06140 [Planctomycetota bacterium]
MQRSHLLAAALLPLCTPVLTAQGPARLVTLTRSAPGLHVFDIQNCTQVDHCAPLPLPTPLPPVVQGAGDLAWDPHTRGAWITDGFRLAKVDDQCQVQCPVTPLPAGNGVVSGLEVFESRNRLFSIDTAGVLTQWIPSCPPTVVSSCQTGLTGPAGNFTPTGIAIDEGLGYVFYAITDFGTGDNALAVATVQDPCTILQRIQVQACPSSTLPFQNLEGLTVDWCNRVLYATDGRRTMALNYQIGIVGIAITGQTCCPPLAITQDRYSGIAIRPGREEPFGQACSNGLCPNCPMRHSLGNDPNVGNARFFLRTAGVPRLSLVWNLIGLGPCNNAPVLPPLCGPIHTNPLGGVLGPFLPVASTTGACDGFVGVSVGVPPDPYFCGIVVSSQALALCFDVSGGFGTSLSNCVTFECQGN